MSQQAKCRVCSAKQAVENGRMISHLNAQKNPCTGSYNIVRPNDIEETGAYDHLLGATTSGSAHAASTQTDLGMQVMPPLNEEAVPYGGSQPVRGDGMPLQYANTPGTLAPEDADSPRVKVGSLIGVAKPTVHAVGEDRYLFVPDRESGVLLDPARYCGTFGDDDGHPHTICLQPRGPHEHVWTDYVGPRTEAPVAETVTIGEPEVDPVAEAEAEVLQPPSYWAEREGVLITEATGWISDEGSLPPRDVNEPITYGEFLIRVADSETRPWEVLPNGDVRRNFLDPDQGRKLRDEHDQPLPTGDETQPDVQSLVIADIVARREIGIQRYGQALKTFNGRNTTRDWYEELLDATIYARSIIEMQAASRDRLIEVVTKKFQEVIGYELDMARSFATEIVDAIIDTLTEGS